MQLNLKPVLWTRQFNGQSPGDLENKNNGFAGRFMGYVSNIQSPSDKIPSELPVMLVVGDSIIGDVCVSNIREQFRGIANVNFLQQVSVQPKLPNGLNSSKNYSPTQTQILSQQIFSPKSTLVVHSSVFPHPTSRI